QSILRWWRHVWQVRQHGAARVAARRRAPRGIQDDALLVHQDEIAASTHRFYNEHHPVVLAGGVSLFAVHLEHALEPRLANSANARVAQVLAGDQAERRIALDTARGQANDALHARLL